MTDKWLGPDTCGVKLSSFERMAQQMTRAAPELDELSRQLWHVLSAAGVSTAPAMEVKRIAAWTREAAIDLRRRNLLAHNLDRQKIALRACRPDGIYLKLPDRYTDQVDYADGLHVARLLISLRQDDTEVFRNLRHLAPEDVTPMFAKAILEGLGAEALLRLPMVLCLRLGGDVRQQSDSVQNRARDTRAVLAILGRSLALATNPTHRSYVGDEYLAELQHMGAANFPPLSRQPNGVAGYQSLSTLISAADKTRFAPAFLQTIGKDMVAYDATLKNSLQNRPLPDLTGKNHLGNALALNSTTPGPTTDFLIPLLNAATISGRQAAQSLLDQDVNNGPILGYLLHDRLSTWANSDQGQALGTTITTATAAHDPTSERLAFQAGKVIADNAHTSFNVKEGTIQAANTQEIDALSNLRPQMAQILATHIPKVNDIYQSFRYGAQTGSTAMNDADLDYLLLDLTRNATAFDTLLKAQIAHAKVNLDQAMARSSRYLESAVVVEGWMFGHLLEARNQSVAGETTRLAADEAKLKSYVEMGIGLITEKAGENLAARTPVAAQGYNLTVTHLQEITAAWITKRLADKPDPTIMTPKDNTEAIEKLFNQMIASSLTTHGHYDGKHLEGRSFATPGPDPSIRPFESMNAEEFEAFLRWASTQSDLHDLRDRVLSATENGQREAAGHYKNRDGQNARTTFAR
ncbi:hypothetical protein [Spirillospora sp. CA-294931]|uniref:hypothetical protein n=1 Tax=Spirillospora sp. CA-294931 TaxID=3240042 RepID=UPI003D91B74B